jgi:hypothetical protein
MIPIIYEIPYLFLLIILMGYAWRSVYEKIDRRTSNQLISQNTTNLIYALTMTGMSFVPFNMIYVANTIGFFIHDLVIIQRIHSIDSLRKCIRPMILHHILTIHGVCCAYVGFHREVIMYLFYSFELSNLLLFVSYHFHKVHPEWKNTNLILLCFQFIVYSYLRVGKFGYDMVTIFADEWNHASMFFRGELLLLSTVGIIWTNSLGRRLVSKIKEDFEKVQ